MCTICFLNKYTSVFVPEPMGSVAKNTLPSKNYVKMSFNRVNNFGQTNAPIL